MITYKITQDYCKEDIQYVSINMESEGFELLLGYIIFKFEDLTKDYPLIAYDMAERLLPLYGSKKVSVEEYGGELEMDLHHIRECHCGTASKFDDMEEFYHPKLKEKLIEVLNDIKAENS